MKILFLSQIVPFPPDAGPKVKTWNVLRYLHSLGHEVVLVTYCRPEERGHLSALKRVCAEVHAVPMRRSRLADAFYGLRSILTGRPFLVERDDSATMRAVIRELLAGGGFDAIHADQLTMTQFALPHGGRRGRGRNGRAARSGSNLPMRIFDAHNAVWTILNRMVPTMPWPLRPLVRLERNKVRAYEGHVVTEFEKTLAVSKADREELLSAVADPAADLEEDILIVPIAVDTQELLPLENAEDSKTIVAIGTLHYPPNADGIRWFMRHVFPLVQQKIAGVDLIVIGKNPPADIVALGLDSGGSVQVTGYVPKLDPYLQRCAVMVVPVRSGGGMRVRILEGFARGIPMVTTTIGLEGIAAEPGVDIAVADREEAFASEVVALLTDPARRRQLSANGRRLAEARYDWNAVLGALDRAYR